jgi:hypothetical protein
VPATRQTLFRLSNKLAMRNKRQLMLLIMLAAVWRATPSAKAAEYRIECPGEVSRESLQVVRPPAGWTPFVPLEYVPGVPLTTAGIMFGPPSQMAVAKPNSSSRNVESWTGLRPAPGGLWMACFYGEAGTQHIILSRRLDDATKECTVTQIKDARKRVRLDIRCRS